MFLLGLRAGVSAETRTEYWVRVDVHAEEVPLAVSLDQGLRLWHRERLADVVGTPRPR